jgi:cytochrome c-type biogenesis protein CcmH/NrfG
VARPHWVARKLGFMARSSRASHSKARSGAKLGKWIAIALVVAVVGGAVAFYFLNDGATAVRHFERAERAFKDKKHREALIELSESLRHDPDHVLARYLLAQTHLELGDSQGALRRIEELQRIHFEHREFELTRIRVLLARMSNSVIAPKHAATLNSHA